MQFKKWQKISEKKLFGNNYWEYRLDIFKIENGEEKEYHYVQTPGSTMVVPLLSDGRFLLTKQYRYLNRATSIEFPNGGIIKGFSPHENARKELREETGFDAKVLLPLGKFNPFNGVTNELCHLFLAKELFESPLPPDETEEFELLRLTADEINSIIASGELWDGMSLAAWSIFQTKKG